MPRRKEQKNRERKHFVTRLFKVDNFFKNMAKESIDSSEENLTSGISTDEDIDTIEFEKKLLEINCNTMEQTQPC